MEQEVKLPSGKVVKIKQLEFKTKDNNEIYFNEYFQNIVIGNCKDCGEEIKIKDIKKWNNKK